MAETLSERNSVVLAPDDKAPNSLERSPSPSPSSLSSDSLSTASSESSSISREVDSSPSPEQRLDVETTPDETADPEHTEDEQDFCIICLDVPSDGEEDSATILRTWCCRRHKVCINCLKQYLYSVFKQCATNQVHAHICCPYPGCPLKQRPALTEPLCEKLGMSFELQQYQLLKDKNAVRCPACTLRFVPSSNRRQIRCSHCQTEFCRFHGLDHAGLRCPSRAGKPLMQRIRDWWWIKRHTRKCPRCKAYIEKNGGCNHMTCRCGHEICWRCGGNYVKNGRRGHTTSLFPHIRDLRYSCNTPTMWLKRVCAAIGLVPIAVVYIAAVGVYLITVRPVVSWKKRRMQRRRRIAAQLRFQERMSTLHSQTEMCLRFNEARGRECMVCHHRDVRCAHETLEVHPGYRVCTTCNHFRPVFEECSHFYSAARCIFCGTSEEQATSEQQAGQVHDDLVVEDVDEADLQDIVVASNATATASSHSTLARSSSQVLLSSTPSSPSSFASVTKVTRFGRPRCHSFPSSRQDTALARPDEQEEEVMPAFERVRRAVERGCCSTGL